MRMGKWARLALVALPLVAGCDAFWNPPDTSTGSGGCTTGCTTLSSGNFYILNTGTSPGIVGNSVVSGKLTGIAGSPWSLPSTPFAMSMAPSGMFLYVSTIAGVYVYPITSGALGSYAQVSQDATALAIQLDTTGTWLLEALQATGGVTLAAVPLSTSTGSSTGAELTATFSIGNAAVQNGKMAISSDGNFVFVALGAGGTIAVPFNAGAGSGTNTFGTTGYTIPVSNTSGSAISVAVDPSLRLFYVGETLGNSAATSGGLRAFNYSSLGGTLTQATGSPMATGGLAPNAILPNAAGTYVYVGNGQGTGSAGNISSFAITASGSAYTIAAGSTAVAGIQPYGLVRDSTGNFLLSVNSMGGPYLSSYTDSTTAGKLDVQIFANTGTSPQAIVAAP